MSNIQFDIVREVINTYKKYECADNVDCDNKHIEFWIQCLKTGIAELESDLSEENIQKELADIVMIGIDGLYKLGYLPNLVLKKRLDVNSKKDLSKRDINFYKEKEKKLLGNKL